MTKTSMRNGRFVRLGLVGLALLAASAFGATPPGATASPGPARLASATNLAIVPAKAQCADLARIDLTAIGGAGSRVTGAIEATSSAGQPVCTVDGTLAPTIGFRVELPLRSWTQRYLQTGCGGLCGNVNRRIGAADDCPTVAAGGFVVASTDMGHQGMGGDFGKDSQKRADFAYRGVHLTALAAKALIRAFYGQEQQYAYFSGCSDGGREALVEAQRFPEDFDGIVAGAPAMNFQVQNSLFHGWQARSNTSADGAAILTAAKLPILHAAVVKACDGIDGQIDGLLSTPQSCRFDPMTIACKPGEAPSQCLTTAEATVAQRFYAGPRDAKTGLRLTQGGPQYGSELSWAGVYVPQGPGQPIFSAKIAMDAISHLIFADDPPAALAALAFDSATFERLRARHTLFDATDPDLSLFSGRGSKLILFHGWADPHISPINTIAYHDAVRRRMGSAAAGFERLYLMPGVYHCSGGEGPSAFDLLTPLMAWVEHGHAPDAIVTRTPVGGQRSDFGSPGGGRRGDAPPRDMGPPPGMAPTSTAPVVARSRPVYPYPYIAAYAGKGDPDRAASYVRGKAVPVPVPTWAGSDFYRHSAGVAR